MDAPVMYVVRFWVDPKGREQLFAWLDSGHNKEVVGQPGFRFVRRLKLEQKSEDGWESYMMMYGLESREALENYFGNKPLHEKFARERGPFAHYLRMDRAWGSLDFALDH